MKIKVKLDDGAFAPVRAHKTDAGLDIRAKDAQVVFAKSSAVFHTGVHIELPIGHCGILVSKSGLDTNYGITSTGLIDEGYTGEIIVKLYNNGLSDYMIEKGDKITQLVIVPCLYVDINLVNSLAETTDRGANGFGSTGR